VAGELFVTPLPPGEFGVEGVAGGGAQGVQFTNDVLVARPTSERFTRVYPLGTVTSYVKFPEVEQTLREVLSVDGIGAGDVKLSLHDKTNILVVNGAAKAHGLIEQYVAALGKDATVRDAQHGEKQLRDLKQEMDRLLRQLDEREHQINILEKARAEGEVRNVEIQRELKLLKGEPKPR
jgi:hypothetical protein